MVENIPEKKVNIEIIIFYFLEFQAIQNCTVKEKELFIGSILKSYCKDKIIIYAFECMLNGVF